MRMQFSAYLHLARKRQPVLNNYYEGIMTLPNKYYLI